MPILLEIKFYILWATNPALAVFAIQTDIWPNGITLIQYRDTLMFSKKNDFLEAPGIDPGTSRMLSERSTIWATPPPCS